MAETYKSPHIGAGPGLVKMKDMWYPLIFLKLEENKFEKIEAFEARSDDIWLCSYPKSGTSWLQQIIYLLVKGENDPETKDLNSDQRVPYFEGMAPVIEKLKSASSPRMIKTHLTFSVIPPTVMKNKAKVIYIARNVKDVSVSDYHFHQLITNVDYKGSFQDFYQEFIEGKLCYSKWWDHVTEFWKVKDAENVLFVKYEDLHKDATHEIGKIAKFLEIRCEQETLERIVKLTTFSAMKEDPKVNQAWQTERGVYKSDHTTKFLRKGKVGDWKNYYSNEMSQEVDLLCENTIKPLGLDFDYEI